MKSLSLRDKKKKETNEIRENQVQRDLPRTRVCVEREKNARILANLATN